MILLKSLFKWILAARLFHQAPHLLHIIRAFSLGALVNVDNRRSWLLRNCNMNWYDLILLGSLWFLYHFKDEPDGIPPCKSRCLKAQMSKWMRPFFNEEDFWALSSASTCTRYGIQTLFTTEAHLSSNFLKSKSAMMWAGPTKLAYQAAKKIEQDSAKRFTNCET